MLKVELHNFRSFDDKTIELPLSGLVKINGSSGHGKSSVLDAIGYALYGEDVTDNIRPLGKPKTTCSVAATIANLAVKRQKSPELLEVNISNQLFQNESAQGAINNVLSMSFDQFMASSYVKQKMTDSLLTLAPAEMMRFIQKVAFGADDPEIIKQKINAFIKESETKLEINNQKLSFTDTLIKEKQSKINELSNEISISTTENCQEQLAKEEESLKELEKTLKELFIKKDELSKQILKIKEESIRAEHAFAQIQDLKKEIEYLTQELSEAKLIQDWPKFTKEESDLNLKKLSLQENYFIKAEQAASILTSISANGYLTDTSQLNKEIYDLEKQKDILLALSQKTKIDIEMTKSCSNAMGCPHCQNDLYLFKNQLIKDKPLLDISELLLADKKIVLDISLLDNKISKYKEICAKIKAASDQLNTLGEPPMSSIKDMEHLQTIKTKLVSYIEENKQVESKKNNDIARITKQLDEKNNKIIMLNNNMPITLTNPQTFIDSLASVENTINEVQCKKDSLSNNIKYLYEKKILYTKHQELLRSMSSLKEDMNKLQSAHSELLKDEKTLVSRLENLKQIKLYSDQAASNALNSIVQTININAKHYIDILFPDLGTSVSLSTTKINKDDSVRAKMSIKIFHKGTEYNSLKELSGGEQSRVCLAYQLALSDLFNSPILMLDEAFSGLQTDLKEECIEALKTVSLKKLIIIAEHGTNDALFDEVIEI